MDEAEVRAARSDPPVAPLDAALDDVHPDVRASRAQVSLERDGHPAGAATDVEDAVVRLQSPQLGEHYQELFTHLVVAGGVRLQVAHERHEPLEPVAREE